MNHNLKTVKIGLALVMLTLMFGIGLGTGFGVAEDSVKRYISEGVAAHPELHDGKSKSKIWRYAQRAHFHATGIAAFSMSLIILTLLSSMRDTYKKYTAFCIGLGGLYPLSWFMMFLLAPSLGREAAHHHIITELCTYIGVVGLISGIGLLSAHLFFNKL